MHNYNLKVFRASRAPVWSRPKVNAKLVIEKGSNSYIGCEYTVGFKVDRDVSLMALEFFGPCKEDHVDYKVRVRICRTEEVWTRIKKLLHKVGFGPGPMYKTIDILPTFTSTVRDCRKEVNFTVDFPKPVHITPNLWTDIKFELIGPETECLKYGFAGTHDGSCEITSKVQFHFMAGSSQLPAVHFVPDYIAY